mmetsp:Transcript_25967/g.60949  ORF Transcript_25967/g.60949 Transcript_25967/m.60949 type:complete len:240 (-) Transcript_25967:321-1040(-)
MELPAGEGASLVPDDRTAVRRHHVQGGGRGVFVVSSRRREVGEALRLEPLVLVARGDLDHQDPPAVLRRQPLEGRRGLGLGGEDHDQREAEALGLRPELVVVFRPELHPFDVARDLILEELADVPGVPLAVLVVQDGLLRHAPGLLRLALGREQPDGRGSLEVPQQPGGTRSPLGVPIGDGDHALDRCRQLLPLGLETLAVSSSLPADVDEDHVGVVHDVLLPVGRRQCHHVGGEEGRR